MTSNRKRSMLGKTKEKKNHPYFYVVENDGLKKGLWKPEPLLPATSSIQAQLIESISDLKFEWSGQGDGPFS